MWNANLDIKFKIKKIEVGHKKSTVKIIKNDTTKASIWYVNNALQNKRAIIIRTKISALKQ